MRLTKSHLKGIDAYSYSGIDKSLLSRYVLSPFWTWLVTLFPLTLAPNTITFLGLCFVFANVGTMLVFDPYYTGRELPRWVYASWAAGLFAYQSMDAIDGKQARRTGMSSALGEMFDHGCDAINTTLEVVLCAHALHLGRSWWTVASQLASLCNFYASTWEEYHTGTLYLSYFSGPVEGILLIVAVYGITAFHPLGPLFWDQPLFSLLPHGVQAAAGPVLASADKLLGLQGEWSLAGVHVNTGFMIFGAVGTVGNIVNSYINVLASAGKKRAHASKARRLAPLLGYLPFMLHSLILVGWLSAGSRGGIELVHDARLLPFIGYWGMSFSYQVSQLILAHVTKAPFPWWNGMMIFSLFGAIDANLKALVGHEPLVQSSPAASNVFICMSFFVALFNYIRFAREIIWQICEHTGIACFTVRHRDANGNWVGNEETKKSK